MEDNGGDFSTIEPLLFDALDTEDVPIYHTNVLLAIGARWVVVCRAAGSLAIRPGYVKRLHRIKCRPSARKNLEPGRPTGCRAGPWGADHVLPPSIERMISAEPPRGTSTSVSMPNFAHSSRRAGLLVEVGSRRGHVCRWPRREADEHRAVPQNDRRLPADEPPIAAIGLRLVHPPARRACTALAVIPGRVRRRNHSDDRGSLPRDVLHKRGRCDHRGDEANRLC